MKRTLTITVLLLALAAAVTAQGSKWMSVGSLQNWYSEYGCEIEEGRVKVQQDGLRWPAIYQYQDAQAAKGLWVGTTNYTEPAGIFPHKVVHVGPRVQGIGEFFPVRFKMISKYEPPQVFVDGNLSYGASVENDSVDPNMKYDRLIDNIAHTSIGLTMHRRILGFSQQFHDNYHVHEYTFTNTGVINASGGTRAPVTLTGVYVYLQYRYAPVADTRYVIGGNPTGWGINTMNDVTGDTTVPHVFFPGTQYDDVRANYSWHGKYPPFTLYDNIGAPIWTGYYDNTDTVGRLGAPHFVGVATLHADTSPTDTTDDVTQPRTSSYEGSDEPNQSRNDQYNKTQMSSEYGWMSRGRNLPRHADKVGTGGDPALGTPGGFSNANGYGPYTIAPGQSVRIVIAEAADGLSREAAVIVGRAFKYANGNVSAPITMNGQTKTKNEWVYTGRDSLFRTFRRARQNYSTNYGAPQPPPPPKFFNVNSGAGKINLNWTPNTDNPSAPAVKGWQVWRAVGRSDSAYYKIWEGGPAATVYNDTSAAINVAHYYYLVAVGDPADNPGGAFNLPGALTSGRYFTQTYDPAYRRTAAAGSLAEVKGKIRVVPNPYNIGSDPNRLLFTNEQDKVVFVNIPGVCTIKIYSELGELIKTIEHTDETGSQDYDLTTSSRQIIASGVYIAVIETPKGEREIMKFVVIR
ncbi:MAG: T9SS type A sorting domain-containing protein [Bacteroidetes bacterium]|nr:MAG: T9SS type A sorting domain-containing protein [Bacteroidota bacterium]